MGAIIALKYSSRGLLEQRCPTHQVLNSSGMVAARVNWKRGDHDSLPDHSVARHKSRRARNPLSPPRRFWRLKAALATGLMVSAVVGFVLAALFLGSIIAALLVIVVVIVSMVVAIKLSFAMARESVRNDVAMSRGNADNGCH